MLYLINRRKQLIQYKRRKLKDEYMSRLDSKSKSFGKDLLLSEDEELSKLDWLIADPAAASRVLHSLVKVFPNLEERKHIEQ
jgi:hypothetical protein